MSIESLQRLLEAAFDEYQYLRSLGNPYAVARERAINAVLPLAAVSHGPATGIAEQCELTLEQA